MRPYRVKLTANFESRLTTWNDVPVSVMRSLMEACVDALEHQSAFGRLTPVLNGHLLNVRIVDFDFQLAVKFRDETFFIDDDYFVREDSA